MTQNFSSEGGIPPKDQTILAKFNLVQQIAGSVHASVPNGMEWPKIKLIEICENF